jgi:methyl acetate hydrolase
MALKISGVNKFASSGLKANAGSWAGLFNSYYWVDREAGTYGIFGTQVLPFYDTVSIETLLGFEQAVYLEE